jgi:hypothetical protein
MTPETRYIVLPVSRRRLSVCFQQLSLELVFFVSSHEINYVVFEEYANGFWP